MTYCKKRLATIWFGGAGILFFIVLLQTLLGRFENKAGEAWSWLLPTIMPTLMLIIGVLVMDALGKGVKITNTDRFLFRLTFFISIAYLLAVLLVIAIQPFSTLGPFELMTQSNFWLGPFQGLVSASLGAFFVQARIEEEVDNSTNTNPA